MEILYKQKFDNKHSLSYWFGGHMVKIVHKGYKFNIHSIGDVRAFLYDETGNEIAKVIDKNNAGIFYGEMTPYITDDDMLLDLVNRDKLIFYNNNWFECHVYDTHGEYYDMPWVLDSMNIYNGIQEVLQSIDEVIKNIEEGR